MDRIQVLQDLARASKRNARGLVEDHSTALARGLHDNPSNGSHVHGYCTTLGLDIVARIAASQHSPFVVLDVACGHGNFLYELQRELDGRVAPFGIDPNFYVQHIFDPDKFIIGDALDRGSPRYVIDSIPDGSIDLVTLQYLALEDRFPAFAQQVHRILAPDGLAKIFQVSTPTPPDVPHQQERHNVQTENPLAVTSGTIYTIHKNA